MLNFIQPCGSLSQRILSTLWIGFLVHIVHEFKSLINYFRGQLWVQSFSRKHNLILAFPNKPNGKRKVYIPRGIPREIAIVISSTHTHPLLYIAPPKILICLLDSQLHPHRFDLRTVSQSVDTQFCTHDLIKENDWNDHLYTQKS